MSKKIFFLILAADLLVIGLVFSISGVFNANVDTNDYVLQIEQFMHPGGEISSVLQFREFKPLYGFLGGFTGPYIGPYGSILAFDIFFFISLSYVFFLSLRLLEFDEKESCIGVLWLIFGYPLLKYGLSLGTDMSGWFFSVFSISLGLAGIKRDSKLLLVAASFSAVIGMLTKETGVLGLGFVGLYVLFHIGDWPWKKILIRVLCLSIPFLVCYCLRSHYLASLHVAGFWDWYTGLRRDIQGYQTPLYLFGVESSAFNFLIIFSVIGIYFAAVTKDIVKRSWIATYVPLFIVALPMLLWPIYIGRILYIQFLFFIPLSLYGLRHMLQKIPVDRRTILMVVITAAPILTSVLLFVIAKNQSLFDVIKSFL